MAAVPLHVDERSLVRLEWPQVLETLCGEARTPGGRARCGGDLFQPDAAAVRDALAETAEAAMLLAGDGAAPLGGVVDLSGVFRRLRKGGVLTAGELLDLRATLHALHATAAFLARRAESAPRLADRAAAIGDQRALADDIDDAVDSDGRVRDAASPALRQARAEVRGLSAELEQRLERYLRDPDVQAALSDRFHTMRNDRYVLPVRADSKGAVRGIVHDASASGTTLFIEPEAVVETNNRLKSAELTVERETLRVLRDLSVRAAAVLDDVEASLAVLEAIDLVFARARWGAARGAVRPEVGEAGVVRLPQLRHPLIAADEVVPSDLAVGGGYRVLVISGPNAGGKTVAMKAMGLAVLLAHAGIFVPAAAGARVDWTDAVVADIGDEQDIGRSLSTFSAHMANLSAIVAAAGPGTFAVLDEIGVGTDPGEGAALAQAMLEALADAGARVVTTTHYNLLKEMAAVDPRFENASVEFDAETLAPTYRVRMGTPGASSATTVAARMGLRGDVLERANQLLEREDRQLDHMLSELAASRVALEAEQQEAERLRAESEAARADYRARLERLQARRDELFEAMRRDLERAFADAHGQVAAVIRDLQRGGTARDAAHARERLLAAQARTEAEARRHTPPAPETGSGTPPLDWRRARPGDAVVVAGAGPATLDALPDRRGRAVVRVGTARMVVPAERVRAADAAPAPAEPPHREPAPAQSLRGGTERCDLRGLRVEEAIERVEAALDRATGEGRDRVAILHGKGTGALRDAVRRHLHASPSVTAFAPAPPEAGGEGVTLAELAG